MNTASQHNIGAFVAVATSVSPQAASAAVNGAAIDRLAHNLPLSCVVHLALGAATGAPSGIAIAAKLQHSPDGSTWADYTAPGAAAVAQTAVLSAAGTEGAVAIGLASAQRFIRAVALVTLTGGTSPTVLTAVDVVLGGEPLVPSI